MNDVSVLMLPSADIQFRRDGITARTPWGEFDVPTEVYARSLRLDRKYPNNYDAGYLDAWCRFQGQK